MNANDRFGSTEVRHASHLEPAFFAEFPSALTRELAAVRSTAYYPPGSVLLFEKQQANGVFLLLSGEVKLSISSSSGKTLILRIAKPGEILGLTALLSNTPSEVTAEALHPCEISFIRRDDFLRLMARHRTLQGAVLQQLSNLYSGVCEQLRTVGLSASAPEKLARLLLSWSADGRKTAEGTEVTFPLTHEQIAEFLGTSRETVTRTLRNFRTMKVVSVRGSKLTIPNMAVLENFASA